MGKYGVFTVLTLALFAFDIWMDVWMGETITSSLQNMLRIIKNMSSYEYVIICALYLLYFTFPFLSALNRYFMNRRRSK